MILPSFVLGASAKTGSYVKSLKFKKKATITIPTNKKSASKTFKVTIKTKGKASTKYVVTSSNASIVTVKARKNKVTLKAKKPGKAVITVKTKGKNKSGKKLSKKLALTVKKASSNIKQINNSIPVAKFGKVSGTITYLYNKYIGNRADTGAKVWLIPKNGSASKNNLSSYVGWALSFECEKIGVYCASVDGMGNYIFDRIPVGEYLLVIKSNKTTSGSGFDNKESYEKAISNAVSGYVTKTNADFLGKYIGYQKYTFKSITVYENDTTNVSYDFGITYI
jgi:23S rRNA pseudoU1915 N3-methylase RlmH